MYPHRKVAGGAGRCLLLALLGTLLGASTGYGVAFISSFTDENDEYRLFTDLTNQPDALFSWDGNLITYKLDATIYDAFPLAKQRQQIRLGMQRWSEAHNRARGTEFDYTRQGNDNSYFDLRSIVMHEMGHVLGSQHVDVAWDRDQMNYVPTGGGGWMAQADMGTEIMQERIARGEIRRILTHDELDMHDHAYNRTVTFQEVFGNTPADITILACDGCLGFGGVEDSEARVANQPISGRRITEGIFYIGDGEYNGTPIGFKTLKQSWEFENDFFPQGVHEVVIRTRGTDNPNPISQSNHGLGQFDSYGTVYIPTLGILNFEDMAHRWFNASLANTVPLGSTIRLALEQDVPDWYVISAAAQDASNNAHGLQLITLNPWQNDLLNPEDDEPGEDLGITGKTVLNNGVRIVAPDDLTTSITEISLAKIGDLGLKQLEDLSGETLELLRTLGLLETIPLSSPIVLGPGEDYVFVFDGERSDLPSDMLGRGNFMLMNRPDLANEELFLFAGNSNVKTYGVIGSGVYVPEPRTLAFSVLGIACGIVSRGRRYLARTASLELTSTRFRPERLAL